MDRKSLSEPTALLLLILMLALLMTSALKAEEAEYLIYDSGFEMANFQDWTGYSSSGVDSWASQVSGGGVPRVDGEYYAKVKGLKEEGDVARCYKVLDQGYSEIYFSCYWRLENLYTAGYERQVMSMRAEDSTLLQVRVGGSGSTRYWIVWYKQGGCWHGLSSDYNFQADHWYHVEVYVKIHGSSGRIKLWCDAAGETDTVINVGSRDTNDYGNIVRVDCHSKIWDGSESSKRTVYYDRARVSEEFIETPTTLAEWVEEYEWTYDFIKEEAEGFYGRLLEIGWVGTIYGNSEAEERHFEKEAVGGADYDYVEKADFAFFAGHGSNEEGNTFVFGTNTDGDGNCPWCVNGSEAHWGDIDLDWIVLSSCYTLELYNEATGRDVLDNWGFPVFELPGLHAILGFNDVCIPGAVTLDVYAGEYFVGVMTGDIYAGWGEQGEPQRIGDAWKYTTINWQKKYYEGAEKAVAVGSIYNLHIGGQIISFKGYNDYLPGYGFISSENQPTTYGLCYTWWEIPRD